MGVYKISPPSTSTCSSSSSSAAASSLSYSDEEEEEQVENNEKKEVEKLLAVYQHQYQKSLPSSMTNSRTSTTTTTASNTNRNTGSTSTAQQSRKAQGVLPSSSLSLPSKPNASLSNQQQVLQLQQKQFTQSSINNSSKSNKFNQQQQKQNIPRQKKEDYFDSFDNSLPYSSLNSASVGGSVRILKSSSNTSAYSAEKIPYSYGISSRRYYQYLREDDLNEIEEEENFLFHIYSTCILPPIQYLCYSILWAIMKIFVLIHCIIKIIIRFLKKLTTTINISDTKSKLNGEPSFSDISFSFLLLFCVGSLLFLHVRLIPSLYSPFFLSSGAANVVGIGMNLIPSFSLSQILSSTSATTGIHLPVYFINRNKDVERRDYTKALLKSLGFNSITRVNAWEVEDVRDRLIHEVDSIPNMIFRNEKEIACIASHLWAIYLACRDDEERRLNEIEAAAVGGASKLHGGYALIVEDDITFEFPNTNWEELIANAPRDFSILQISTSNSEQAHNLWKEYHILATTPDLPSMNPENGREVHPLWYERKWDSSLWSTQAYIINIAKIKNSIHDLVKYEPLMNNFEIHLKPIQSQFPCYQKPCLLPFRIVADIYLYTYFTPTYMSRIPLVNGIFQGTAPALNDDLDDSLKSIPIIKEEIIQVKDESPSLPVPNVDSSIQDKEKILRHIQSFQDNHKLVEEISTFHQDLIPNYFLNNRKQHHKNLKQN